jgi:hypothetical protein
MPGTRRQESMPKITPDSHLPGRLHLPDHGSLLLRSQDFCVSPAEIRNQKLKGRRFGEKSETVSRTFRTGANLRVHR